MTKADTVPANTEISIETVSRYFFRIPGTRNIRFTKIGIDRFKSDFAKVGYSVENIKTIDQFFAAHNAYLRRCFDAFSP